MGLYLIKGKRSEKEQMRKCESPGAGAPIKDDQARIPILESKRNPKAKERNLAFLQITLDLRVRLYQLSVLKLLVNPY